MLQHDWRDRAWSSLDRSWDLIIIGGGITGAGILREAARAGLHTLLIDANDFSFGTSSRSSKLVHGGLRYLKNAQFKVTLESVRERERLLREGRGLVSPLGFLLANFKGDLTPGWLFGFGLIIYDIFALRWGHKHYSPDDLRKLCPVLTEKRLIGGYRYLDTKTDDARLVLRVIREAVLDGAVALNYARAEQLLRRQDGTVCGVAVRDMTPAGAGRTIELKAPVVINATGAWVDDLRAQVGGRPRMRKLRGSHLIFSAKQLPVSRAVTFLHPKDSRPLFVIPWEGTTLFGTTDIDHEVNMDQEPAISLKELEYLLDGLGYIFPSLNIDRSDVISSFAGIRAVVNTGKANPSQESREYVLWKERGLLTISGGKLTTFRLMAHAALRSVRAQLPGRALLDPNKRILNNPPDIAELSKQLEPPVRLRLLGRYGADAVDLINTARPEELVPIGETTTLAAELRWTARYEGVIHLDDLLLRRTRIGLLLPGGGLPEIDQIQKLVQGELRWDNDRWEQEVRAYTNLWQHSYYLPT